MWEEFASSKSNVDNEKNKLKYHEWENDNKSSMIIRNILINQRQGYKNSLMFHKIFCCLHREEKYSIKSCFFVSPISILWALREKLNGLSLPILIWSLKYRDLLEPLEGSLFFGKEKKNTFQAVSWNHTGKSQTGPLLQFSKIFHCLQSGRWGIWPFQGLRRDLTLSYKHALNNSNGLHW